MLARRESDVRLVADVGHAGCTRRNAKPRPDRRGSNADIVGRPASRRHPGNEILNAERNCSRYIVLPRAATQGASSGEPLLTCGKLFQVNAGTDGVLPRGVQ